jgi:hypothetical protein
VNGGYFISLPKECNFREQSVFHIGETFVIRRFAMNLLTRSHLVLVTLFILVACRSTPTPTKVPKPAEPSVHPTEQLRCSVTPYATDRPPDRHTASYTDTWYGNEALWAGLSPAYNGEWYAGPKGLKMLWYRSVAGSLTVEGKRLDALAAGFQAVIPDGYGDSGFQASVMTFSSEGCWEVIGRVADQELRFVVNVHPAEEHPIK